MKTDRCPPRRAVPRPMVMFFRGLTATSLALLAVGCSSGSNGTTLGPGVMPDTKLSRGDELPGLVIGITDVIGGSGPGGSFLSGDTPTVRYTLELDDGQRLALEALNRGSIMVSGPTFNYHRVIEPQSDLTDRSVLNDDGTYSYTFAEPLPAAYLPPPNDTDAFTLGEMTGEALLDGTYTVGIEARVVYDVDGDSIRDPGNATKDFLFGGATDLQPREVVTTAHCNQCHDDLSVHGDNRTEVKNCLLCHTTGAEDRNVATASGTPGALVDFRVMIHKIHAGKHLPSVLGVTTNSDGTRKYDATPEPYVLVGYGDRAHDYSEFAFPRWPTTAEPMPADNGYGSLTSAQQDLEDSMRSAPVDCAACHGDPDGDGPLAAPAQGDLIYSQPTTAACGSCHDDWVPEHPYTANTQTMPPQRDDSACTQCHRVTGSHLDVKDAHTHPMVDPDHAKGVVFEITAVREAGTNNGDGNLDAGEKVEIDFSLTDSAGNAITPSELSRWQVVVNGPTVNPNMLLDASFPAAALSGSGPSYTTMLPEGIELERVGDSTTGSLDTYATTRTPHWNVSGAGTGVILGTITTTTDSLAEEAGLSQNYVDLTSGGGSAFSRNDLVAVGTIGTAEVLEVVHVDDDRLWFGEGHLRRYHASGTTVTRVTASTVPTSSYTLDASTGVITETTEFGAGIVLVDYTTDFTLPSNYPCNINDSPDLEESWGDWSGLSLLDGTYTLGMLGRRDFDVTTFGETSSYPDASEPATVDFLVGDADTIVPNERISSASNCASCHTDIQFHGGTRRGYQNCLLCHGVAGSEDRPQWVAPNAPETAKVTVDFRTMLHKIHHGKELADPESYEIVGYGRGYPNNYSVHTYEHVGFPAMPGGTMNCAMCHGDDNDAWKVPASRNHPNQAILNRTWRSSCTSCHDSAAARAHVDANTAPDGGEACSLCHGDGEELQVPVVHKSY